MKRSTFLLIALSLILAAGILLFIAINRRKTQVAIASTASAPASSLPTTTHTEAATLPTILTRPSASRSATLPQSPPAVPASSPATTSTQPSNRFPMTRPRFRGLPPRGTFPATSG